MKGKCIYCNKEKKLNQEHAFPKFLLQVQEGAPEWILEKHLCVKCNSALGKLDQVLQIRGPIGRTWSQINSESGQESNDQQSLRYNQKSHGLEPDRMLVPDPVLGNRIGLFKLLVKRDKKAIPLNSIEPLVPQIILTLHTVDQTIEQATAENAERFAHLSIDLVGGSGAPESIYWVKSQFLLSFTLAFPPKATAYFLNRPREFASMFLTKDKKLVESPLVGALHQLNMTGAQEPPSVRLKTQSPKLPYYFFHLPQKLDDIIRSDLIVVTDRRNKRHGQVKSFVNSVAADQKKTIDAQIYLDEDGYANLPRSETLRGRFLIAGKAESYIERAIAKIAFHCFLYHYREFSGHESAFGEIKQFIYKGEIAKKFVTRHQHAATENVVYQTNEHFHVISFFTSDEGVECDLRLFTGLVDQPFCFRVALASKIGNLRHDFDQTVRIPFYVNPEGDMKRWTYDPGDGLGIIQEPSLEEIFYFGRKFN